VKVVVVGWKLQYPLAHLNRLLGLEQPKGPQDDPEVKGWLQGLPSGSRRLLRLPAHTDGVPRPGFCYGLVSA
jgi:hypothetical protein